MEPQELEPQELYIKRFDILKFYEIDTIGQRFKCQFFLHLLLPGCAGLKDMEPERERSPEWYIQKIEPQNISGNGDIEVIDKDSYKSVDQKDLIIKMRFQGTFFLDLDLKEFPFDKQKIMIRMIYIVRANDHREALRAQFKHDESKCDSSKLIKSGYMNPRHSWTPIGEDADKNTNLSFKTCNYGAADRLFPAFEASFEVRRRRGLHYNITVAFPSGIISLLSLVTFSFPLSDGYANRVTTSLALLITAAAYQQVVTAQVPNIDYMTRLDFYIFSNFVLLSFVTLVSGLLHLSDDLTDETFDVRERTRILNFVFLGISCLAWLYIQILWFTAARQSYRK